MGDRVHPKIDSRPTSYSTTSSSSTGIPSKPAAPEQEKPVPPPGTYVIQLPKDQIYRYPPPENAQCQKNYVRKKPRGSRFCRCCLFWTFGLAILLLVLLAVAAAVMYLVFRPEAPKYSVNQISIKGLNLTSPLPISPEFDVSIRAQNPNDRIGIYYEKGSSVDVYYSGVRLCTGVLPVFYQPSNNVTVFETALKGSSIVLSSGVHSALLKGQREKKVSLRLNLKMPAKIKVGAVKTWTINVKVRCELTVDSLTARSRIVSKDCDYSVKLW